MKLACLTKWPTGLTGEDEESIRKDAESLAKLLGGGQPSAASVPDERYRGRQRQKQ